jgi:hypothetical protein
LHQLPHSSFNDDEFLRKLETLDWNSLYLTDNIDAKIEIFNKLLRGSYDKHAPYKVIHPKHLPAPWLTADIKAEMKKGTRPEGSGGGVDLTPTTRFLTLKGPLYQFWYISVINVLSVINAIRLKAVIS